MDLVLPPRKLPGTLWTPETVSLELSTGSLTAQREVYAGAEFLTNGPKVARFAEVFFNASKGKHHGTAFKVRPHQQMVLDGLFRLDPVTRKRVVRQAVLCAPRKYGKSTLAAPIALWMLLLETADGLPEVYGAAGDRAQASIVMEETKRAVLASPELMKHLKVYRSAIEVIKGPNKGGVYRVLSSDATLAQGLSPTAVLADEPATWRGTDLFYALSTATGARDQPLMLLISTPGFDKGSLYYKKCDYGRRVNSGEIFDPSYAFYDFSPTDPEADWQDPMTWLAANPGLGDYLSIADFEAQVRSTPESEFRRYKLAQWVQSGLSWLRSDEWESAADRDAIIDYDEEVTLVVDGSYSGDATAMAFGTDDGRVGIPVYVDHDGVEKPAIWEKPPGADTSWRVPTLEVEEAVRLICQQYRVKMVAFDPFRWQRVMDVLLGEGLPVVEYPMGQPSRMVRATSRFESGLRSGHLRHDGDPILARHVANCTVKIDRMGARPEKASLTGKIDAAICSVVAYDLATAFVAQVDEVGTPTVTRLW